jgi:hypothetical protein
MNSSAENAGNYLENKWKLTKSPGLFEYQWACFCFSAASFELTQMLRTGVKAVVFGL